MNKTWWNVYAAPFFGRAPAHDEMEARTFVAERLGLDKDHLRAVPVIDNATIQRLANYAERNNIPLDEGSLIDLAARLINTALDERREEKRGTHEKNQNF